MSLNYSFTDIENYKEVCNEWIKPPADMAIKSEQDAIDQGYSADNVMEGELGVLIRTRRPVTEALVWATLTVGIGKITKANVAEFITRIRVSEAFDAHFLIGPDGPMAIPSEEIVKHIGLVTNVTSLTRTKWVNQYIVKQKMEAIHQAADKFVNGG